MSSTEERAHDDPLEQELLRAGERVREELLRRGAELVDREQEERARLATLALLRGRAQRGPAPASRMRRVPVAIAAVAAVALLGLFLWFPRADPGPVPLGPGQVHILAPKGGVSSFATFTWEGDFPAGTRFVMRLFDETGRELSSDTVQELRWSPRDESSLPRKIRWKVTALDSLSEPVASDEQEAWRSP